MARKKRRTVGGGGVEVKNLLLFPGESDQSQHKGRVFAYRALIAVGFVLAALILWIQSRMPEELAIFNPFLLLSVYALIIYILNRSAIRAMPVSVYYSKGSRSLVFIRQSLFSKSESLAAVSDIERIDLVPAGAGPSGEEWKILIVTGGSVLCELPPSARLQAKQGAVRIAGAAMAPVVIRDASGGELSVNSLDDLTEPLIGRLGKVEAPRYDGSLHIEREKTNRGIRWEIGFPLWIPVSLFIFSLLNIFVGLVIWFAVDTGAIKLASGFFFINSFIILSIAMAVKSFKRTLELTGEKIRLKNEALSVSGIEEIRSVPGIMPSLDFLGQDGALSIVVTGRQANWLKKDIESELWQRYGKNRK
jgi:hypothetical protein